MQDNSDFDNLINDDEPQEEFSTTDSFFNDLPQEHREFVAKLIADYQFNQSIFEGIRNILIIVATNITSSALALWMIRWGSTWYAAFFSSLLIAVIPGLYDVGKFLSSLNGDRKMELREGVFGGIKIISGCYATYQATTNWRDISADGKRAIESVRAEIKDFEVKPQPTNSLLDSVSSIVVSGAIIATILWGFANGRR